MGLILNNNVEESKIYSAYGLTVYGKVNRYVWTIDNNREENALTTIRVVDAGGSYYIGEGESYVIERNQGSQEHGWQPYC